MGLAVALEGRAGDGQRRGCVASEPRPSARLVAFVGAYLALAAGHLDLVLMSQTSTPDARLRTGVHAFWRQHCAYLLRAAGAPHPGLRADLLLAGLAADQVRHWLHDEQRDLADLTQAVCSAARALAEKR